MEYKGYIIEIKDNNSKEYPYKAVARKGFDVIEKRGISKEQAKDLVECLIDFSIAQIEMKKMSQD